MSFENCIEHFELETTSTLRTSAAAGASIRIQLGTDSAIYSLGLEATAYDPKTQSLTVSRCELRHTVNGMPTNNDLFSTSCTINANEYTVLGSTGKTPLFTILRLVPLDRASMR